jgi:murein DD-endopeptidase MepM/ murein hydrolase activator NlpD
MDAHTHRAAAIVAVAVIIVGMLSSVAVASQLSDAKHRRTRLGHSIDHTRHGLHGRVEALRRTIAEVERQLAHKPSTLQPSYAMRWHRTKVFLIHELAGAHAELRATAHAALHRLHKLQHRRAVLSAWIARWGVLQMCPVRGPRVVTNNFGVTVNIPGVPVHIHQGNDIMAGYGTPIVAPFAGNAVASPNVLGGLAVEVYGAQGYVYNAHLERYGTLGHVRAGTVIGYVGSTGDAGGPHDHFEWHPGNGPAVDPYPYLSVVC